MSEEVNFLDYYRVVRKRIRTVIAIVVVMTVSSAVWSLFLPIIYKSKASILILGGGPKLGEMSAIVSQLSFSMGNLGWGEAPPLMALLQSRTLAERVIERFDLMKFYNKDAWDPEKNDWKEADPAKRPSMELTINDFRTSVSFSEDIKRGIIMVTVLLTDPVLAAEVANGIVDELQKFINENEFTDAKKNRVFIGDQLLANRRELLEAGKELSEYYQRNRISSSSAKVDVPLELNPEIEEGISNRLASTSDAIVGEEQIRQLQDAEQKIDASLQEGEFAYGIPQQVYLEYLIQKKEILRALEGLLSQEHEMVKIAEAKENLSFRMLDKGLVPEKRIKPQRRKIVIIAFAASAFLAVLFVFFLERFGKMWKELTSSAREISR